MTIRTKITLTFFSVVIVILSIVSIAIYLSSSAYRQTDFQRRLKNRATNTAKLLLEIEGVSPSLMRRIDQGNPANLPNQYVRIMDSANATIYSSQDEEIIPVDTALISRIRAQGEATTNYEDFEVLGFMFREGQDQYVVVAAAQDIYGFNALTNLRYILVVIFLCSLVIVSIVGWFYAGRVLEPISNIVSEVDSITEASLDRRLDEGNNRDELSKLSQTFNRMLSRIQQSFVAQKNFISNASHELRTPLAIISAEVDAALLQKRNSDEYVDVLRSVHESIKGLNALSTQLLMLAQTTANHPDRGFTSVRIDDILWEAKVDVERVNKDYKVDIHFDPDLNDDALNLNGDPQLLKALFTNLIDNGCKYSDNSTVVISLRFVADQLIIEFANTGPGVDPNDVEKIFAPFYRGKGTQSRKGFGIGLPLSMRIVKLHEGSLEVTSSPGVITKFTVTLPVND